MPSKSLLPFKGIIALISAITMLLAAISELRSQKKDARVQWDNFGEYTVPEIEMLKVRVTTLEKKCQ